MTGLLGALPSVLASQGLPRKLSERQSPRGSSACYPLRACPVGEDVNDVREPRRRTSYQKINQHKARRHTDVVNDQVGAPLRTAALQADFS